MGGESITAPLITLSRDAGARVIRDRLQGGTPRRRFHPPRQIDGMYAFDEDVPRGRALRVMVSTFAVDAVEWVHASCSRLASMPGYEDMKLLHEAVWPGGHAYQVFVPPTEHYNYHKWCLHLWGRADGARVLPDFADPETGGV